MYYIVRCTYVEMYISDLKKNLSKMFHKYSELYLLTSSPQAGTARKARRDSTCRRMQIIYHVPLSLHRTAGCSQRGLFR
jgi:hypothetical protein